MAYIIGILKIYNFPLVIIHNGVNWKFIKSLLFFTYCIYAAVTTVPLDVSYGGAKPLGPSLGPLTSFPGV